MTPSSAELCLQIAFLTAEASCVTNAPRQIDALVMQLINPTLPRHQARYDMDTHENVRRIHIFACVMHQRAELDAALGNSVLPTSTCFIIWHMTDKWCGGTTMGLISKCGAGDEVALTRQLALLTYATGV